MVGVVLRRIACQACALHFELQQQRLHDQLDGAAAEIDAGAFRRVGLVLVRHDAFERLQQQRVRLAQITELHALRSAARRAAGVVEPERFATELDDLAAMQSDIHGREQAAADELGVAVPWAWVVRIGSMTRT